MGLYMGGLDPLKIMLGTLNTLMKKGHLTKEEAEQILTEATDPKLLKEGKKPFNIKSDDA
jgi:hypothetical protein